MKNKIKNFKPLTILRLTLPLIIWGGVFTATAQHNQEIAIYAQGPFSKLNYELMGTESDMESSFGVGLGIQYAYNLSQNWSLGIAAQYTSFEGRASIANLQDAYSTTDNEGEDFEFRYTATNYVEKQHLNYATIPISIRYMTSGRTARFYAATGFNIGFDIGAKYEATADRLTTSGYYEQYNVELMDPKFMGFGDFDYSTGKKDLTVKNTYALHLESGIRFPLENGTFYQVGFYLDYGLNDLNEEKGTQNAIDYNTQEPTAFIPNSLFNATRKSDGMPYIKEVKTLSFGLKIQYGLGF